MRIFYFCPAPLNYNSHLMTATLLIFFYSIAIIAASLFGGWLPSILKLSHTRTQILMSYVAGLMLGVAFYHLLPHAIFKLSSAKGIDYAIQWLMAGLLFMFVLLRIFRFHQHSPAEDDHHDHNHADHHDHHQSKDKKTKNNNVSESHSFSWLGVAFGLALHTLIDGIALGASVQAHSIGNAPLGLLGLGVFVAIVLHKPLDAMSISTLMAAGGWSMKARTWVNFVFAMMCPLGAYIVYLGAGQLEDNYSLVIGSALAFSAGAFICISLSDLLPEIQFHSHDRGKLTMALLLGVISAYGIGIMEPEGNHSINDQHHEVQHQKNKQVIIGQR